MLSVTPIPAFSDNYIWSIENDHYAVVIDPGEADPVEKYLDKKACQLSAILLTHQHADHIGGVKRLLKNNQVPVYGPADIALVTNPVVEGEVVYLFEAKLPFEVIAVPGHTLNHIAFYGQGYLFCGDTLFSGGCGRLFEGTPEMMLNSLDKLAKLPLDVKVCCAHEYTLANLTFAQKVESGNQALKQRFDEVSKQRQQNIPSLPSTIAIERETNPFLRVDSSEIISSASRFLNNKAPSRVEVFAAIRTMKDKQ